MSVDAENPVPVVAQESDLVEQVEKNIESFEKRLSDIERVNARLEAAALTTARAMTEISRHWEAVYETMRRTEEIASDQEHIPQ
jgi:hypothetical protein